MWFFGEVGRGINLSKLVLDREKEKAQKGRPQHRHRHRHRHVRLCVYATSMLRVGSIVHVPRCYLSAQNSLKKIQENVPTCECKCEFYISWRAGNRLKNSRMCNHWIEKWLGCDFGSFLVILVLFSDIICFFIIQIGIFTLHPILFWKSNMVLMLIMQINQD